MGVNKKIMNIEISAPFHAIEVKDEKQTINPVYSPRLDLSRVLLNTNLVVVSSLEKAVQVTEYDAIATALVNFFRSHGRALALLKFFIKKEIRETVEASTLFRGVSLTTKMVSSFCMLEGQSYCKGILDPLMRMFCIDEVSIEVDPAKLEPGEDIKINQEKLLGVCKGLLNHIIRSVDNCSLPLRCMLEYTRKQVSKKFPEHHLRVVGGFYFLRFLCPALVCPEGFGVPTPSPKSRRSLILVSKAIQNLANDVEFGEKENYMVKVNPFIKTNQAVMWRFLENLASPLVDKTYNQPPCIVSDDPLLPLYKQMIACREKLKKIMQSNGHLKIFEKLFRALDVYGKGEVELATSGPFLVAASRLLAAAVGIGRGHLEADLFLPMSPVSSPPSPIPFTNPPQLLPTPAQQTATITTPTPVSLLPPVSSPHPTSVQPATTSGTLPAMPAPPELVSSYSFNTEPSTPSPPLSTDIATQAKSHTEAVPIPSQPQPERVSINMKEIELDLKLKMTEIQTLKARLANNEFKDVEEKRAMQVQFQSLLTYLKQTTEMLKTLKSTPTNAHKA
jgi:hypothetical protein